MVLIGRYLSPFVRRVAVTLHLYEMPYEHRPLMAFGEDKDHIREHNPVGRVPALRLDDGEVLVDSAVILDYLDQRVGPDRALTPPSGPERWRLLSLLAIAAGATEKAVATVYEVRMRPEEKRHAPWVELCSTQAKDGFEHVDRQFVGPWLRGETMTQLDVSALCCWLFVQTANPGLAERIRCPNLDALAERALEIPAFTRTAP